MHARLGLLALPLLASGCLSNAYRVPVDEVWRLAQTPPEQRPEHVRVSQLTSWDSVPDATPAQPIVVVAPAPTLYWRSNTPYYYRGPSTAPSVTSSSGSHSSSSSGGSLSGLGSGRGSGNAALGAGIAVLVVAVAAFAILAGTEASRFDGWAQLDPNAQLMLHRSGSWVTMPISMMTQPDAYASDDALVLREGAFYELGRAPLHRVGFAYGIDAGAAAVTGTRAGDQPWWPSADLRIGYFPLQWLGIYAYLGFVFAGDQGALVDVRFGGELQLIPLQADIFHFGIYGRAGDNFVAHENVGDHHGFQGGGGLLMEIDVLPHMGVTLRGGASAIYEGNVFVPAGEVLAGATVY